ncbi:FAD:protein FMN transferase [Kocuria sp. M1R5S2]|uniref:FAD:protein FMN transferase n=1 Tax=Kocuria rhizosphaerae TaxID=3376285 RepID=UPI0037A865C8
MSAPTVELRRPEGRHVRHREMVWGTTVSIDVRAGENGLPAERVVRHAVDVAVANMHWVDAVFSTYRPDSVVTALRTGMLDERRLSRRDPAQGAVLDVVQRCREGREMTGGCFDPWAVRGGFDPSGYVKAWAAERIADDLVAAGCANVCVDAGGDVVTRGAAAPGLPWEVGIRHPDDPGAVTWTLLPGDGAVSTSGTYERPAHIVDPRTGRPAGGARSASVVGPDARLAGVLATALVVAGRDGAAWFAGLRDWSAYVVDPAPAGTAWSLGRDRYARR